jgi:hypothetical protein
MAYGKEQGLAKGGDEIAEMPPSKLLFAPSSEPKNSGIF